MKKIALVLATVALAMAAGSALATPAAGTMGLNVGFTQPTALASNTSTNFMVNGKYFISKDTAVLAGVGLVMKDSGAVANSKSTDIGFQGGFRKYMKTDDFSPFAGGRIQYVSTRQGANDVTDLFFGVEGGAEYFLAKQFSLEGSVGFGYASSDSDPVAGGPSTKATYFGTTTLNVSANFYF